MSQLSAGKIIATTGVKLPSFTSSNRPGNPDVGLMIFQTTDEVVEIWNGSEWVEVGGGSYGKEIIVTPYGGSATTYNLSTSTATTFSTQGFYSLTAAKKIKIMVRMWGAGGGGSIPAEEGGRGPAGTGVLWPGGGSVTLSTAVTVSVTANPRWEGSCDGVPV